MRRSSTPPTASPAASPASMKCCAGKGCSPTGTASTRTRNCRRGRATKSTASTEPTRSSTTTPSWRSTWTAGWRECGSAVGVPALFEPDQQLDLPLGRLGDELLPLVAGEGAAVGVVLDFVAQERLVAEKAGFGRVQGRTALAAAQS